ncbi:MAG TPA: hypothetical protein VJN43_09100 [Bryobacteraceae bacterium]|nr:hypothetical protein [Bryobacteraceae bacterium]
MSRISIPVFTVFACALGLLQGQADPPKQVAPPKDEGLPARATPADYQFHAQAGNLTLAAEFTGHNVGTPEGTLTTEDYVVVEAAIYGPDGARTTLSPTDFTIRINKKKPETAQPYGLVVSTLKDFQLEPTAAEQKEKTSVSTGGGQKDNSPPPPFRVPDAVRHEWRIRLQKISMPEGDRALPKAGLLYFPYRGKTDKIQSIELTYNGPAGKCSMALEP